MELGDTAEAGVLAVVLESSGLTTSNVTPAGGLVTEKVIAPSGSTHLYNGWANTMALAPSNTNKLSGRIMISQLVTVVLNPAMQGQCR